MPSPIPKMHSGHFTKYQTNLESVSDEASKIVLFRLCFSTSKIGSQKQLLHPGTVPSPDLCSFHSLRLALRVHTFFSPLRRRPWHRRRCSIRPRPQLLKVLARCHQMYCSHLQHDLQREVMQHISRSLTWLLYNGSQRFKTQQFIEI